MQTFLAAQRQALLHQHRHQASDLQVIHAKHIRGGERLQGSTYLHRQLLFPLHSMDKMAGVLLLVELVREVVEEHPCVGHPALRCAVTESLVHQGAIHTELNAVVHQ